MPKDTRRIVGSIRHKVNGETVRFRAGQEDELQEHLTAAQLSRLSESGVLTGDWGTVTKEVVKAEAPVTAEEPATPVTPTKGKVSKGGSGGGGGAK